MRAVNVFREKITTAKGIVVETKVWAVPKLEAYPEGVKYSFFAVYANRVLVWKGREEPYLVRDFDTLRADFVRDLAEVRKEAQDGSQNVPN